jgi:hypothetical protein
MNTQLLKRIQLLESEYLIEPSFSTNIIVRFVEPSNPNENLLMRVRAGDDVYERMVNETENDFVGRILNLTNEKLLIQLL